MPVAPSHPFPPPPTDIAPLLADLRRGDLSFNAIAARHSITPDTLALWLNSPNIRQQLEATDTVSTWRTRLIAAESLPRAIVALNILLQRYITAHQHPTNPHELAPTPQQPAASSSTSDIPHPTSHIPSHEAARRAAATLVRIANLRPTPSPDRLAAFRAPAVTRGPQGPHEHAPLQPHQPTHENTASADPTPQTTHDLIQAGLQAAANLRAAHCPADNLAHPNSPAPSPTTPTHPAPSDQPVEYYTDTPTTENEHFNPEAFQSDLEALLTKLESNPEAAEDPSANAALFDILQKHMPIQAQAP